MDFEGKQIHCHPNMVDFFHKRYNSDSTDILFRPYKIEIKIDENLPKSRYKLLNEKFRNDRFTHWFDLNNPPSWAINLDVVKEQKCYYIYDSRRLRYVK